MAEDDQRATDALSVQSRRYHQITRVQKLDMEKCMGKNKKLTSGKFVDIFKASPDDLPEDTRKLYTGMEMIVKKPRLDDISEMCSLTREDLVAYQRNFEREEEYSHLVRSPFLMPLICYAMEFEDNDCYHSLMYPMMEQGDLYKHIFKKKKSLTWQERARVLYHVALAVETLHKSVAGRRHPIVHRDIKSSNILLDVVMNARLGDQGLCKEFKDKMSSASNSSSDVWRDVYKEKVDGNKWRRRNDWYSFGIVGLELLMNKPATQEWTDALDSAKLALIDKPAASSWHNLLFSVGNIVAKGDAAKRDDILSKVAALWSNTNALRAVTEVVANCLLLKDVKRDEWLGLDKAEWTSLTPSQLLENVCKLSDDDNALYAVNPENTSAKRCIACCALLTREEQAELHTCSANGCSPGQCSWYCRLCMSSREPLFCPKHGRAMPLIGGDDMYALLMCGNDNPAFKQDCDELKGVLEDVRIVGIREDNILLSEGPSIADFKDMICALCMHLRGLLLQAATQWILNKQAHLKLQADQLKSFLIQASVLVRKENTKKWAERKNAANINQLMSVLWDQYENVDREACSGTVKVQDLVRKLRESRSGNCFIQELVEVFLLEPCDFGTDTLDELKSLAKTWKDQAFGCYEGHASVDSVIVDDLAESCASALRRHAGTVWVFYSGHASQGNLQPTVCSSIPSALRSKYIGHLVSLASHVVVVMDCCGASSCADIPSIALDLTGDYSPYVALASCTAQQVSIFRGHGMSLFTSLLVNALSGCTRMSCEGALKQGLDLQTYTRCKNNACPSHLCNPTNSMCQSPFCKAAAGRDPGTTQCFLSADDVRRYLCDHLCTAAMSPVRIEKPGKPLLPMAYVKCERGYEITFCYPESLRPNECRVLFMALPERLSFTLRRILKEVLKHQKELGVFQRDKVVLSTFVPLLSAAYPGCKTENNIVNRDDPKKAEIEKALFMMKKRKCQMHKIEELLKHFELRYNSSSAISVKDENLTEMRRLLRRGLVVTCHVKVNEKGKVI